MDTFDSVESFKRIESELEARLAPKGYVRTKHDYHPETYGHIFTVFSGRPGHVRFTWDGKLQSFILRVYKKRSPIVNTLLTSLMGRYDLDKLKQEITLKMSEIRTMTNEELIRRLTENVEV